MPDAIRNASRRALEEAAGRLVAAMKARAPVADGDLRDSIGWTWGEAPAGTISVGAVGSRADGRMRITIYAGGGSAFYAVFQEFGTVDMPPNAFFFPTYRAERRRIRGGITRRISKAIRSL